MSEAELVAEFTAGRLPRRAFVRQLVERGMPLTDALAFAQRLVPEAAEQTSTADAREATGPRVMSSRPVQADDLEIATVADGYTIINPRRQRVHSLNNTALVVFELCNGKNDSTEIALLLQRAFALAAPPLAETQSCLESMFSEGLIV